MRADEMYEGARVRYRPHPAAEIEEGVVTQAPHPEAGLAFVLYLGDRTAKATHPDDLRPVVCPEHARTDCSPLLNGCSRLTFD